MGKELRSHVRKSQEPWSLIQPKIDGTILVLLHRFSGSQENCLGYQLCQKLVKEGCNLLVSTISSGKKLEFEIQSAKWLTDNSPGSITLLEPQYGEQEEPSVEWIEHSSSKYFFYLSQLRNVQVIIGILPGTSETAVSFKKELECLLILMATTSIVAQDEDLKNEICKLAGKADEIWSVGNETFSHFQNMFKELTAESCNAHREIQFQPWMFGSPDTEKSHQKSGMRILSAWSKSISFFFKNQKVHF